MFSDWYLTSSMTGLFFLHFHVFGLLFDPLQLNFNEKRAQLPSFSADFKIFLLILQLLKQRISD